MPAFYLMRVKTGKRLLADRTDCTSLFDITNTSGQNKKQKLDRNYALNFLDEVEKKVERPKYREFLSTLLLFENKQITYPTVKASVRRLLEGNPDLVHGFNEFVPPQYAIDWS